MDALIASMGLTIDQLAEELWLTPDHLRMLHDEGHVIGLHSHTDPLRLAALPADRQQHEYAENQRILREILGEPPVTVAHPRNSYTAETLAILRRLGVRVGFRADMAGGFDSALECPRQDALELVRELHPGSAAQPSAAYPAIPV